MYNQSIRLRKSSDSDSSSDRDEDNHQVRSNKIKTELCKTYQELGYCPYQQRCRFAHGKQQLIKISLDSHCKTKKCNGFWKNGCCSYGVRCRFGHAEMGWQASAALLGLEAACCERVPQRSKLMRLLN